MRKLACLLISALLLTGQTLSACSVFFAFDGKSALAGDNEDYADHPPTQMWTVPRTEGSYATVYFGFGRGAYPKDGAALSARIRQAMAGSLPLSEVSIEDAYGLPMQGMNEKGLFCGGAETEIVPSQWSHAGLPKFEGDIMDLILRHAASVPDALQLTERSNYWMPEGNLLCADATGDSFILEAGGGVLRGNRRYQIATNFLQSVHPDQKKTDQRYSILDSRLSPGPALSLELIGSLLDNVKQDITQYSAVFDLANLKVQVYQRRDFRRAVTIRLMDEWAKGPTSAPIRTLFE
jgi:penicillin V acylase-like amidase (Ntn superfamily)